MRIAAVLLLAVTLPSWWRETNSHASAARGAKQYQEREYAAAARSYARANELAPSPQSAFNLGTAEIASGKRAEGSARLAEALKDPALRADAFYNRGTSALRANALDHAIRDLQDALRANPSHAAAKRNLEIALTRKRNQQQQPRTGGQQQQPNPQQNQQQPQPAPGQQQREKGQMDANALLRSVQQQEQEELRRMRGRPEEGRVGW